MVLLHELHLSEGVVAVRVAVLVAQRVKLLDCQLLQVVLWELPVLVVLVSCSVVVLQREENLLDVLRLEPKHTLVKLNESRAPRSCSLTSQFFTFLRSIFDNP